MPQLGKQVRKTTQLINSQLDIFISERNNGEGYRRKPCRNGRVHAENERAI